MSEFGPHEISDASTRVVRTVRQLNEDISAAVSRAFPTTVWVRGEVQRLPQDAARRKHVYFELHEAGQTGAAAFQIPAQLLDWDRRRFNLGRYLDGSDPDFQLANKLEVCLECRVDFYAPFGKLGLKVVGVDPAFSLGQLEARRRQTLAWLREHDLLDKNRSVPLPTLPLCVGLITAPESAAHHDFLTGIAASPWAFDIRLRGAKMQGERLQAEVVQAMAAHLTEDVDVIVLTRGGGSRADLSWFDQQDLAEAIARCPVPVITAIGHEIDRSIADTVAHQSCKTPTAAADFLVGRVDQAAERVTAARDRLLERVEVVLTRALESLPTQERVLRAAGTHLLRHRLGIQKRGIRLQQMVSRRLGRAGEGLGRQEMKLGGVTRQGLATAAARLENQARKLATVGGLPIRQARTRQDRLAEGLVRETGRTLTRQKGRLDHLVTQARLLDPARLLARGYTLTTNADGRRVAGAADLSAGDLLVTRFADGQVKSIVQPGGQTAPGSGKKGKRKNGGKKENPGQETLFR